jgi:predicted phage terminase large subunit-like protein
MLKDIRDICRESFPLFAAAMFPVLNPGQRLVPTYAFLAAAYALQLVAEGKIKRLIINVPPRSAKSFLGSICLPAWILGRDSTRRIICVSYSIDLATKHARDCRLLMAHPSYRFIFPDVHFGDKNTEIEMTTTRLGYRLSSSTGGTLTGRGGDPLILDDILKPQDAMSKSARDSAWEWFGTTAGSRLDNKAMGGIVVIEQRLHVSDISGRLLEQGGYHHVCVPAMAEEPQTLEIGFGRLLNRERGHVLDPVREPPDVLQRLRQELGTSNFEAQYQQRPVPLEGAMVKRDWFGRYLVQPHIVPGDRVILSWDCAMKDREINDYSVGIVSIVRPNGLIYILDVIRHRYEFPDLRRRVISEALKYSSCTTLVEDAGSGTALIQELRRHSGVTVLGRRPMGEKAVRLMAVCPHVEARKVWLPEVAPWLPEFERELLAFPAAAHDDQVDAFTQLLSYINGPRAPVARTGVYARQW